MKAATAVMVRTTTPKMNVAQLSDLRASWTPGVADTRGSSQGADASPAIIINIVVTNAPGPIAPNGVANRLAMVAKPSAGSSKLKGAAATAGKARAASCLMRLRTIGP